MDNWNALERISHVSARSLKGLSFVAVVIDRTVPTIADEKPLKAQIDRHRV